ncbi:PREDICTED: probable exonuclease mut-7 homolog [Elephantulus edwardii]|uniref:probable exonuclease mut-7 homolog n=1 Tax=Elephantulus edwardii TaxID=28737 RepID=UPI0003F08075|nr:PREDICTED: probable exonuclease mut-7 homolog [Elephantulus edwardii]
MDPGNLADNHATGDPTCDPMSSDPAPCDPTGGLICSGPACSPTTGPDPVLFLQGLQAQWPSKDMQQLQKAAWQTFAALDDPLAGLLDMLEASPADRKPCASLQAWVVCELQHWLHAQPVNPGPTQGSPHLRELQTRAAEVLTRSPASLTEPLISIFQLQDADRRLLLDHISHLHDKGKFKEAVLLSVKLKLQPELDIEKMSVPLLLQNKMNLVERYVEDFPDLQRRLLVLMDSWCQPGFNLRDVTRKFPQMTSVRQDLLRPKLVCRQVLRLLERYNMDSALCPNVINQQRLGTLRYLCYKRFVERTLSQENWADHVQDLVGQSEWLQSQLLQLLTSHCSVAVTAQCAQDLSLPEGLLPAAVATELSRLREREPQPGGKPTEPRGKHRSHYYQPPITREDIYFLATWEDVTRHEPEILQPGAVVGVDLEWKPLFQGAARPSPSLVQLALEGRVLLLDLHSLSQPPGGQGEQALWQLLSRLFSDPSITKLGYGLEGDLRSLGAVCPALADADKAVRGVLDLQLVHQRMRADTGSPCKGSARAPRGLSLLVQQVLGQPLDKTQQLSNWDLRPLREQQLIYAATDAYCLLEVYRALCRDPARFRLSENLAKSLGARGSMRSGVQRPSGQPEALAPPPQVGVPAAVDKKTAPKVLARDFRVVCDNMLQGLARGLRCLGVDVRVLGTGDDHRRAAEVARQEGRIILTSGLPYHKLRAQVGPGRCLQVDCSLKAREQVQVVLKHFNVFVTLSDVFSRCQVCNCDQYLKVSQDMMRHLMQQNGHHEGPSGTGESSTQHQLVQPPGPALHPAPRDSVYDRPCRWLEASDLETTTPATLGNGTRLQLGSVPMGVLRRPGQWPFYCCTGCGKVFWEGSHLSRVTAQFQEVLGLPPLTL